MTETTPVRGILKKPGEKREKKDTNVQLSLQKDEEEQENGVARKKLVRKGTKHRSKPVGSPIVSRGAQENEESGDGSSGGGSSANEGIERKEIEIEKKDSGKDGRLNKGSVEGSRRTGKGIEEGVIRSHIRKGSLNVRLPSYEQQQEISLTQSMSRAPVRRGTLGTATREGEKKRTPVRRRETLDVPTTHTRKKSMDAEVKITGRHKSVPGKLPRDVLDGNDNKISHNTWTKTNREEYNRLNDRDRGQDKDKQSGTVEDTKDESGEDNSGANLKDSNPQNCNIM